MTETIGVFVSVPVAGFRVPHAREYVETLPVPPPSTLYGMFLSLVGEESRASHKGAELALAMLSEPPVSVVLRTTWRVKNKKLGPGKGNNRRPDFQELLTDLRLAAWIRPGKERVGATTLCQRVADVLDNPAACHRFGGLSLGESTHLVDELRRLRPGDLNEARPMISDSAGDLSLTIWPNHVGSKGTNWGQYRLLPTLEGDRPPDAAWISIDH